MNKAWADDDFKKRVLANPAAVLKEHGVEVPPGVQIRVVENTDQVLHLTMPPKSSSQELTEADMAAIAGGLAMGKWTAADRAR